MPLPTYDCQWCGACCRSTSDNRRVGYQFYIEISPRDAILQKPHMRERFVILDEEGVPHMKLTPEGRCQGLRGPIGGRVRCDIYDDRPSPCRKVEAGSDLCKAYRRDSGLSV